MPITPDWHAEALQRYAAGETQSELARSFNVSRECIRRLVARAGLPSGRQRQAQRRAAIEALECRMPDCSQPVYNLSRRLCRRHEQARITKGAPELYTPARRSRHGTHSHFVNYNCRCNLCVEAHELYVRDIQKRRRKLVQENSPLVPPRN